MRGGRDGAELYAKTTGGMPGYRHALASVAGQHKNALRNMTDGTEFAEVRVMSDDVAFYREHGWWVSDFVLSSQALDDLAYAVARYASGERDRPLPRPILPQWSGTADGGVRQADYLSLQLDEVMDFVRSPVLPGLAAALSGASEIRLFHDQLIWKDGATFDRSASVVGWHSDRAYWRSCSSTEMLTAWIPLQDTPEEMGPLAVWDGSDLWPDTDELHTFEESDLGVLEDRFRARGLRPRIRLLPMRRGQVSFHHCQLVHGSYPNRTDRPRLAFSIHYQDGSNRHVMADGAHDASIVHLNDMLCRTQRDGTPDYKDPEVCPLLWTANPLGA